MNGGTALGEETPATRPEKGKKAHHEAKSPFDGASALSKLSEAIFEICERCSLGEVTNVDLVRGARVSLWSPSHSTA